ncbi:MAG: ATP-binding cassette domain-containing protein [Planctomycetes bacterium]|nr:ATP-binding cassette domain-containing protein [Planctomycetota bacterium]
MITVDKLTKFYGPVAAVRDISFSVEKGEIIGFIGPNGAGKSTTMKILTGYLPPSAGSATLAGFDVIDDSLSVRRRVGYLPENNPLYVEMRVGDYLHFAGRLRGLGRRDRIERIGRVTKSCGLESVFMKSIDELSKGYRQRVGLAQALIHDPDILILDEPTSGLDPNQTADVRALLKTLGSEKTVILSTHILPEVEAICSRVLIINEGVLVAQGTTTELQAKARGENLVLATIRGPSEAIQARLRGLAEVMSLSPRDGAPAGCVRFAITPRDGEDITERVFETVRDAGWSLKELTREQASLEDVFRRLSRGRN